MNKCMKRWMNKLLKFIREKNAVATIILVLVALALICVPLIFFDTPLVGDSMSKIEIAEKISQIFASIFVIVGSFIALSQYYIYRTTEKRRIEDEKIERALKLSEYYKDNVIEPYSVLSNVYQQIGVFDILYKEKKRMLQFTENEMNEIFSAKEIKEIERLFLSKEFFEAMVSVNEIASLNLKGLETKETFDLNGKISKEVTVDIGKLATDFRMNYVSKLMNNMEQFAMYFTHNIADESVVYQSLYPTYIEMCIALYYDISKSSQPGKAQLYRNVQKLYVTWKKKTEEKQEKINGQSVDHGTISKNVQ